MTSDQKQMTNHFCPVENQWIGYQGECNWCGEKETLQRTWVGLTDEEIGSEYVRFEIQGGFNRFEYAVRAIEAKLKEKNT